MKSHATLIVPAPRDFSYEARPLSSEQTVLANQKMNRNLTFVVSKDQKARHRLCVCPPSRLLLSMHHLPANEDSAEGAAVNRKRVLGVTADGTMWIYHLVQYAQVLLNQQKHAQNSKPFSPVQRQAWDRWDNRTWPPVFSEQDRIQLSSSF